MDQDITERDDPLTGDLTDLGLLLYHVVERLRSARLVLLGVRFLVASFRPRSGNEEAHLHQLVCRGGTLLASTRYDGLWCELEGDFRLACDIRVRYLRQGDLEYRSVGDQEGDVPA